MSALLELKGVSKWFGDLRVLDRGDLAVDSGEVVVVIGASGAGKSTLIRCVNGLEPFQRGSIRIGARTLVPDARQAASWRPYGGRPAWSSSTSTCFRTARYWRTSPWHR